MIIKDDNYLLLIYNVRG